MASTTWFRNAGEPDSALEARPMAVATPWYAYVVPLHALPLEPDRRPILRESMTRLVAALRETAKERSVFLLLDELYKDNAIREISRYGRQWRPEMGLGLRPEAEPPRYWTEKDLTDRDYDSQLPALKHTVAQLDTDEAGAAHACEIMSGTGGLIQILHTCSTADLIEAWNHTFVPGIEEEGLAAYPIYVPLLTTASLTNTETGTLDCWMGRADVYVRESASDKALLLVSRFALDAHLRACGFIVPEHTL